MHIKLFFKKLFKPYAFKYIHTTDYYLNLFYDDLVNLDSKICLEHDRNYVNHLLYISDYKDNILKFRDCLESLGFKVQIKHYVPPYFNSYKDCGIIFTVYLDNLWELL